MNARQVVTFSTLMSIFEKSWQWPLALQLFDLMGQCKRLGPVQETAARVCPNLPVTVSKQEHDYCILLLNKAYN